MKKESQDLKASIEEANLEKEGITRNLEQDLQSVVDEKDRIIEDLRRLRPRRTAPGLPRASKRRQRRSRTCKSRSRSSTKSIRRSRPVPGPPGGRAKHTEWSQVRTPTAGFFIWDDTSTELKRNFYS